MPYSRITGTRFGADAIGYAKDGRGHDGSEGRNQYVGMVNMLPDNVMPFKDQMQIHWDKASTKCKNQVRRVIQSFSVNELNPENPEDVLKANRIGQIFADKAYPGHQAVIFTQTDGKSGLIHNHIIINNVNMYTHKGCNDNQTKYWYVQEYTNKIAEDFIILDDTKQKANNKTTQTERQKRKEGKYIWKDDLKERVKDAMEAAFDRNDFLQRLEANGVKGTFRKNKNHGEFILYELVDKSNFGKEKIPSNLKAKSYKMGTDYDVQALDDLLKQPNISRAIDRSVKSVTRQDFDTKYDTKKEDSPGLRPVGNPSTLRVSGKGHTEENHQKRVVENEYDVEYVEVPEEIISDEYDTDIRDEAVKVDVPEEIIPEEYPDEVERADIPEEKIDEDEYQDEVEEEPVEVVEIPEEELIDDIMDDVMDDGEKDTPETSYFAPQLHFGKNTNISSNKVEKRQEKARETFQEWLDRTGQSYITFDDNMAITDIDFDKKDRLIEEYEKYLEAAEKAASEKTTGMEEKRDATKRGNFSSKKQQNVANSEKKRQKETAMERHERLLQAASRRETFRRDAFDAGYRHPDDYNIDYWDDKQDEDDFEF